MNVDPECSAISSGFLESAMLNTVGVRKTNFRIPPPLMKMSATSSKDWPVVVSSTVTIH